jgi:ribosomal protein L30/L7E
VLAAIRLKSAIKASKKINDSFKFVNLKKRNTLTLVDDGMKGVLIKLNPYIAWGEISKETLKIVKQKMKDRKFLSLAPITLKSAKQQYPKGDLGHRNDMDKFVMKALSNDKFIGGK